MHPLFVRLVAMALCASIAGAFPARADDTGARAVMGLFGAILNEAQQQKQQPRQQQSQSQGSDVEWENPKSSKNAVNSAERTRTKKLQAALKTLGYYKSSIDGLSGPTTTAAIKAWQKQVGQEPDGIVTDDQVEMLSLAATVKQQSAASTIHSGAEQEAGAELLIDVEEEIAAERAAEAKKEEAKKAEAEARKEADLERKALLAHSLKGLPVCASEDAVDALKQVLGERLIDWDTSTFCEDGLSDGQRECLGHVTLATGEARIAFKFKRAKSDPNKFLTQIQENPLKYYDRTYCDQKN